MPGEFDGRGLPARDELVSKNDGIAGKVALGNSTQCLPAGFGEYPCVNPGFVPERSFLETNVQEFTEGIKELAKPRRFWR